MKKFISFLFTITLVTGVISDFSKSENNDNSSEEILTRLNVQNTIDLGDLNRQDSINNSIKDDKAEGSKPMISSYSNTSLKFNYPSEWSILENPTEDILYVEFSNSKIDTEPILEFSMGEACLVNINRTLEEYETILSRSYSNVDIKELTKESINDNELVKLIFTCTLSDKEYTIIQYEMINGYASFTFKYIVPDTLVDNIQDKANSIIKSIEFF